MDSFKLLLRQNNILKVFSGTKSRYKHWRYSFFELIESLFSLKIVLATNALIALARDGKMQQNNFC